MMEVPSVRRSPPPVARMLGMEARRGAPSTMTFGWKETMAMANAGATVPLPLRVVHWDTEDVLHPARELELSAARDFLQMIQ